MSARPERGFPRDEFPLEEFIVPQVGVSPITGIQGTVNWGGMNRADQRSRWVIGDADFDSLINAIPQGVQVQQVPYKSANIATLAASVVWMEATYLNGNPILVCLCSNGHIYQVTTGGSITDIRPAGGFSVTPPCDFTNWQNTTLIITDPVVQTIYSWNGSTFATVFSSQPTTNVEVFQNRLWMFNGLTITWTNVNTFNSFAGDAGSVVIIDNDAQSGVIQALSFFGNLYLFGSNWIKTISSLQDVGSPAVLLFNLTSITGQIGVASHWSVIPVGNVIYFANAYGIWQLAGSAPIKISGPIDGIFQNISLSQTTFSSGYGEIYNIPCLFWQIYYNGDQILSAGTYLVAVTFVANNPNQWFMVQQGTIAWITSTAATIVTNNLPVVWGTDGTNIFRLFTNVGTTYTAQLNTKIWDITGSKLNYKVFEYVAFVAIVQYPSAFTVAVLNEYGNTITTLTFQGNAALGDWINNFGVQNDWINNSGVQGDWQGGNLTGYFIFQFKLGWRRRGLGFNIQVSSIQAIMQSFIIGYHRERASRGP